MQKQIELNLIRKLAWSFHNTTGIEFEELYSEASLAYCEAILCYNKSCKTKLTTYQYQCIHNHLINYCKKIQRQKNIITHTDELELQYGNQISIIENIEGFKDLSSDALYVIRLLVFKMEGFTKTEITKNLISYLKNKNWNMSRIWKTTKEIKEAMNY